MTFAQTDLRKLPWTEVTHAVARIRIARCREEYPEFQFELKALCGAEGTFAELDMTRDAAVDCAACMEAAGVR